MTDALIEAGARALCKGAFENPDALTVNDKPYWMLFADEARVIIAALRPLIEAETREALAACMIRNGVATGHGDTHADLIMELDGHFERHRGAMTAIEAETRERCAGIAAAELAESIGSVQMRLLLAALRAEGKA